MNKDSGVLRGLVQEAVCSLEDNVLCNLTVSQVVGTKNSSDIKVCIFEEDMDEESKKNMLKKLRKASALIHKNALVSSGWVHFPSLTFLIDETFSKQQRMEDLFAKIKKDSSNA